MLRSKSIMNIVDEDKNLKTKVTAEEFNKVTYGIDDSSVKEAYENYMRVKNSEIEDIR